MKIIIDNKIPYIEGVFEKHAEVLYMPGADIKASDVKDADVLITRTRTLCNQELLEGSSVKLIATATIGYDHIDTDYCDKNGIAWANAPGCNASSVVQYVAAALLSLAEEKNIQLNQSCIGIVGVGNVGSRLADFCEELGMKVLLNDPPRNRFEDDAGFVELKQIQEEADIISLHVPLNMDGEDATYYLVDDEFFASLKKTPILINTCRGEVVKTVSVKQAITQKKIDAFVCDCWENEPDIDLELLAMTAIATPHIAGYSRDGKAMGTQMSVQTVSKFFNLGMDDWKPENIELPEHPIIKINRENKTAQQIAKEIVIHTYDIYEDDRKLRENPAEFEQQRGDYPVRRELGAYKMG